MTASRDSKSALPTIEVRNRWFPPLILTVVGCTITIGALYENLAVPLRIACGIIGGVFAALAVSVLLDRRTKVRLTGEGIDIVADQTGLIRYTDIVHVECFCVRDQGAVALFLTAEAHARLPRRENNSDTPVLANEAFAAPPIWFCDGPLEQSAADIAAEINARRRGIGGPITSKRQTRRRFL